MEFPLTAFTADTASRLTGLSVDQLHRWDRIGFFSPTLADPNRRRPYSRVYSFSDVVGLRTIAQLRERGVPFSDLRQIHEFFAPEGNEDWANRRFYTVGNRVFFSHEEAVLAARPLGQGVVPELLDLGNITRDVEQAIRELPRRSEDEIGRITHDRQIMGGAPIIAGTRIPTRTIAWFVAQGYDTDAILREFPRLTKRDIDAAIAFEELEGGQIRAAS